MILTGNEFLGVGKKNTDRELHTFSSSEIHWIHWFVTRSLRSH